MSEAAAHPTDSMLRSALAPALLVAVGLTLFPVSGSDDKYITYWSAHALATMGEIVNVNGERVEQSSSLTHVLLLAALAKALPLSLPAIGWMVSVASGAATVWITQRVAARIDPRMTLPAGLLAASAASLVYWSFGGLDGPLAAFLGVAALVAGLAVLRDGATGRRIAVAAFATLLFAGVRPEAAFVAAATWLGVALLPLLRRIAAPRGSSGTAADRVLAARCAALVGLALASLAVLAAFRYAYFHRVFPQPVTAKVGGTSVAALKDGLRYVFAEPWRRADPVVVLACVAGGAAAVWRAALDETADVALVVLSMAACAELGFAALSGGDWMEAGRFLVPAVPPAAILGASLLVRIRAGRVRGAVLAALVAAQLGACVDVARHASFSVPLWAPAPVAPGSAGMSWFDLRSRLHVHLMPLTARLLELLSTAGHADGRPVTILTGQMGFVPYYVATADYGRVRFVDKGGLCTCDVSLLDGASALPRSAVGIGFRYADLFRRMDGDGPRPDWIPPDVIFDYDLHDGLDPDRERHADEHGYTTAFHEDGLPASGSDLLPGLTRWRDAFIVVRADVVPAGARRSEYHFTR